MPNDQATPLQNAFGLTFTVFSAWYFLRVVKKRGDAAKKFRVANSLSVSLHGREHPSLSVILPFSLMLTIGYLTKFCRKKSEKDAIQSS